MGSYEQTMLKLEKMAQANTATQMNWQEKMSKSSHQMEVEDLIKAGLNPVLSANQGANSYTTSVDSAVNGIAGMASAREGASATRYAARQSANATRAAAAAQLEAARLNAKTSTANNVRDNATAQLINTANNMQQKWNIQNQKATNIWSAIDKASDKLGIQDNLLKSSYIKKQVSELGALTDNPSKYLIDKSRNTATRFNQLNTKGANSVVKFIRSLGLDVTTQTKNLATKATFGHSGISLTTLLNMAYKRHNSARK